MGSYVAPKKRKMETMIPKGMEEQEDITEEVETEAKKVKTEAWLLSEKNIPGGKYFFFSFCWIKIPRSEEKFLCKKL